MRVIRARNVNEAFYEGMHLLDEVGVREDSRAGPVAVAPYPVMTIYEEPRERVLFDPRRDANPFFHLMEGLWMLAGRNDSAFLNRYVANFGKRFAESASGKPGAETDGTIHDAYGQRWRSALGYDQLDVIVERLRANPQDRQAVLQMWDARVGDGSYGEADLTGDWRTRPCNTHAYFRVRTDRKYYPAPIVGGVGAAGNAADTRLLDMTICCRSNDAIWGAHGANAVHFSMLLEYLAGRIGVQVGTLYQLSNNYHAYADALEKVGEAHLLSSVDPYEMGEVFPLAMGTNWSTWDDDLRRFMEWHDAVWTAGAVRFDVDNRWFTEVAARVALARWNWTNGFKPSARKMAEEITAPDWRRACLEWMDRRSK